MFPTSETTDVALSEPAVQETKEPFVKPLLASIWIFGLYFALAYLAAVSGWVIQSRGAGLVVFVAATFGLTIIAVFSAVAWPFRMLAGSLPLVGKHLFDWKEPEPEGLLSCAMCASMWIGTLLATLGLSVYPMHSFLDLVIHGLLGSGTTWLLYAITQKLGVYSH